MGFFSEIRFTEIKRNVPILLILMIQLESDLEKEIPFPSRKSSQNPFA